VVCLGLKVSGGGLERSVVPETGEDRYLVLELLTELQGDGEEHQRIIKPRHHTLHLVNVAHLEPVVVELKHCSGVVQH